MLATPRAGRGDSLCLLIGLAFGLPATAAISNVVTPSVAVSYSYDDNLLRVPQGAVTLDSARADTYRQVDAGLLFNKTIGRQVLSGKARVAQVSYRHFDHLNYDGRDLLAAWNWRVGNHVEGNLGASYARTLASYADFQSQERNLRVLRREFFDAAWRFHPSWRLRGGGSGDTFSYELAALRQNGHTERAVDGGIDYLAANGSTVGLQLRHMKSTYPKRFVGGTLVTDNSFVQDEAKAKVNWSYSASTQVQFLGGWVRRSHPLFTQRDASGGNGRIVLDWAPLSKARFSASAWREFSAVENALVTNSLNKGLSLGSTWQPAAKHQLSLQVRRERRHFEGQSAALPGLALDDATRSATLSATYTPLQTVQLAASLFHEARSGGAVLGLGSYRARGAELNASIQF